jgi:probable HAF family extracellular repeat protein
MSVLRRWVTHHLLWVTAALGAAVMLLPAMPAMASTYAVTDLGTLGGGASGATDINSSGTVVGWSRTTGGQVHAFLWRHGRMIDLGTLGGGTSTATGVNDVGTIVGTSTVRSGGPRRGFLWRRGVMRDIGTPLPARIGNGGAIIGNVTNPAGLSNAAYRARGRWHVLPLRGFDGSVGQDVNDHGAAVGFLFFEPHGASAFVYRNGHLRVLPNAEGAEETAAYAIDNSGRIAGERFDPLAVLLRSGGVWNPLPAPLLVDPEIRDMNDCAEIVGAHHPDVFFKPRAFVITQGAAADLNTQIPSGSGWRLGVANAINDRGQIVGVGRIGGHQHAFLLTPAAPTCLG